jgi:DNA polymerase-3 subunit alpha
MAKFKPYVDTHIHTHYSILDGVSSPEDNVRRAKECGAPGLAISDHGTVAGVFEFYKACKKHDIIPLVGNELYMKPDLSVRDKNRKYFHGVFLAMNDVGFRNLMWLSSKGFTPETHYQYGRPVVSFQEVLDHSEGLVFSTGCMVGILGTAQKDQVSMEEADKYVSSFHEVFGDRMFIEIGPAQVCTDWKPDDPDKKASEKIWSHQEIPEHEIEVGDFKTWTNCLQVEHNYRAKHFAKKYNIPLIVASDGHMARPELKKVQDLMITSSYTNKNGWHFDQINSMFSSNETWDLFQENHPYIDQKAYEESIDNTYKVLDFCKDLELKFGPMVPEFPLKIHPLYSPGMNKRDLMFAIIKDIGRMKSTPQYLKRLHEEIKVICDNGTTDYTDYFLILSDISAGAKKLNVGVGPARGSAGGCLLSYLLGITAIDPIKWDLSFTRFLNEGRVKKGALPDIDMDFTDKSKVIEYIFERYGDEHTAMVGSFQTMKTKGALKDIVRFKSGGPLSDADPIHKITKTIGVAPQYYPSEKDFLVGFVDDDGKKHPGHLEANQVLRDYLKSNPDVNEYLFSILEKPRSLGRHAGGIVITPDPIDQVIPTRYHDGQKTTQIDFKTLEKIGGLKIDILGINTLNWICDTVDLVKERHGVDIDPWDLPEDSLVFDMICMGSVETVFQFDTSTVRPFIKRIQPRSVYDLAVITSVCRPGALQSELEDGITVANHFVKRRKGEESVSYIDPILEPILNTTYGLVVFQEQIQKIFEVVGGLSSVDSDNARRAVGKKILAPLLAAKKQLYEGAQRIHGWPLEKCEALYHSFEGAVNYSFNKAHATAYAVIAYACAYLKCHYPLEWWCSVLSNMDAEKIKTYLGYIRKLVRFPHVNIPEDRWTIRDEKLQAPLSLVRGVAGSAIGAIKQKAPFKDMGDFFTRVNKTKVNKTTMLNMAVAGCFDELPSGILDGKGGDFTVEERLQFIMDLREKFLNNKKDEELPPDYRYLSDRVKRIQLRSHILTIATFDVLKQFLDIIQGQKDYIFQTGIHYIKGSPIVSNFDKFEALSRSWAPDIAAVGIIQDSKMFYFNDRRTGQKKGALRVYLENDGRTIETVLWSPDKLGARKKDFQKGNLIAVFGPLKYNKFKGEVGMVYRSHRKLI